MMSSEFVSIITPVYNTAPYLPAMLESVQAQTWQSYEHLIIDDCSTDNSREIVNRYQQINPKIRLVTQEANSGPACARNRGISEAKGEFIAFLDADDLWFPEKTTRQLAAFREHPEIGLLGTGRFVIDEHGRTIHEESKKTRPCWGKVSVAEFILDRIPLTTSSVMMRKACFAACGLFNESYANCSDFEFWMRVVQYYQVGFLDDKLVCYREHGGGISKKTVKSKISKIEIFENEILPQLEILGNRRDEFLVMLQKRYLSLGRLLRKKGFQQEASACFDKAIHLEGGSIITKLKYRFYRSLIK